MKSFLKTLLAAFLGSLLSILLCGMFMFAMIGSIAMLSQKEPIELPSSTILKVDFATPVTEQSTDNQFSSLSSLDFSSISSRSIGILNVIRAIDIAATDPAVKLIYLSPNNMNIGMSHMEEVRNALERFRKSGKPIIAYANNYSAGNYYLASVADKVYMDNTGNAGIFGIGVNIMFFKDLLDKLGVGVQLIRHGKYKAAAEQLISSKISKENEEQNSVMLNSIWDTWVEAIAKSRGIPKEKINLLVDNLQIGLPSSMESNKLIDQAMTRRQLISKMCTLFGVAKEKELKVTTIAEYATIKVKPNIKEKKKIAVIYANGEIAMEGNGIDAKRYAPMIDLINADSSVKAVVLRVNSPGGDAQAAEIINQSLQELRKNKPVIISMGDYAASGGYWISAKSDKIFADRTTITGSIGVFSLFFNINKGLKEHLDISMTSIKTHAHSDAMGGMRPLDESEQKYMESFVEDIYTKFTGLVAKGRNLPVNYVDSIGQGRVWTGTDAVRIKLADEIGGINDAITYAAHMAGLKGYRIAEYPLQKSSIEKLMELLNDTGENAKAIASAAKMLTNPNSLIESSYKGIKEFNGLKTFARIPYAYDFSY
jgi:protease IV